MNISEGKLTVSAAYGTKVPAAAAFSSQEARLSMELEFPVTGEYDSIVDRGHQLEAALTAQLKLAVWSQLGLGVVESADGTIQPDLSSLPAQAAPTSAAPRSGGGGGGFQNKPTKAQQAGVEVPTYNVVINGEQAVVKDRRDIIAAGVYKAGAADFLLNGESVWLLNKDKSPNPLGTQIAEAIAPYLPFDDGKPTPL